MARYKLPWISIHNRLNASELGEQVPWSLKEFGVPAAWKSSRGAGVLVDILDTGIDFEHAETGDLTAKASTKAAAKSSCCSSEGECCPTTTASTTKTSVTKQYICPPCPFCPGW